MANNMRQDSEGQGITLREEFEELLRQWEFVQEHQQEGTLEWAYIHDAASRVRNILARHPETGNRNNLGDGIAELKYVGNPVPLGGFPKALEGLINAHSIEGGSNTPDFVLAEFMMKCLDAFNVATRVRASWYGPEEETREPVKLENAKGTEPREFWSREVPEEGGWYPEWTPGDSPRMCCVCGPVVLGGNGLPLDIHNNTLFGPRITFPLPEDKA